MASTFISAVTTVATSVQTGGQGMVRLLIFAVMAIVPYSIIAYLIYLLIRARGSTCARSRCGRSGPRRPGRSVR